MKKFLVLGIAIAMTAFMVACDAKEEGVAESIDFPGKKQMTIVVASSPGGASDTTARIFASELEKSINGTVLVRNTAGASGAIGLESVRNSKADGYTMAFMPVESTMLRALGFTDLSSDDFAFVGRAMTIPAAVTVRSDSDWETFDDFLAYAKANPGAIQVGNAGTGSIWHIAAASVEIGTGVEFTHVPFDGGAPAIAALLGGNIHAVTVSPSEVKNNVDSGDFRILTVLSDKRSSVVPDVETATEMGIDVIVQAWGAFAVPKDTPAEIVAIIETAAEVAINSDPMKDLLATRGLEHAYLSGSEMNEVAARELEYYSTLIPSLGIIEE